MMRSWRGIFLFSAGLLLSAHSAFAGLNFVNGNPFTVATKPEFFVVADFNNDGHADVAVSAQQSKEVDVILGGLPGLVGPWDFSQGVGKHLGTRLTGIAAGDLNGDGNVDVVITDEASKGVFVLLGNGDGSLQTPVFYQVGSDPFDVAIADFDGKNNNDIAICDRTANEVFILLNDGNIQPVFRGGGEFSTGQDSGPEQIVTGDFDGDGHLDIAVLNQGGPRVKDIGVLYFDRVSTTGFPAFVAVKQFLVGERPDSLTVADLDGDGLPDLAVINRPTAQLNSQVQIRLSQGAARTFEVGQEFTIPCPFFAGDLGCRARALTAADFDNRGVVDLAVALVDPRPTTKGDAVELYSNRGDGFFFAGPVYTTNKNQTAMGVGDVDDDGRPDIIIASGGDLTIQTLGNVSSTGDQPQGSDCTNNQDCLSNVCEDGVCCNSICVAGEQCDVPGATKGICTPVPPPIECSVPHDCPVPLGGSTGVCLDGFCCNEDCTDGVCNVPGFEGVCVHLFQNGTTCSGDDDCLSGACEDGFCCNRFCDANEACNLPGTEGTCVKLKDLGQSCGGDEECASGICDFTEPRICCDRECTNDEFCSPDTGMCTPLGGGATPTPVLTAAATGTPLTTPTPLPNGDACNAGGQCNSGNCVNFVCCASQSCPEGQFCDASNGGTCQVGTAPSTPTPTTTATPRQPTRTSAVPTDTPDDQVCNPGATPCAGSSICCGGICCGGTCSEINGQDTCVLTSSSGGCAIGQPGSADNDVLILLLLPFLLWAARRGLELSEAVVRRRRR